MTASATNWRPGPLWISWVGMVTETRQPLGHQRRPITPQTWERLPDGSGMFNRSMIPLPDEVLTSRPLLRGYTIHAAATGSGDELFLPLESPQRFEENLPYLPPGALQVMEHGPSCQPAWKVWGANRNPYPRWERRLTLYRQQGEGVGEPETNVFFDGYGRICAAEVLQTDGLWKIGDTGIAVQRQQSTRLWIALLS